MANKTIKAKGDIKTAGKLGTRGRVAQSAVKAGTPLNQYVTLPSGVNRSPGQLAAASIAAQAEMDRLRWANLHGALSQKHTPFYFTPEVQALMKEKGLSKDYINSYQPSNYLETVPEYGLGGWIKDNIHGVMGGLKVLGGGIAMATGLGAGLGASLISSGVGDIAGEIKSDKLAEEQKKQEEEAAKEAALAKNPQATSISVANEYQPTFPFGGQIPVSHVELEGGEIYRKPGSTKIKKVTGKSHAQGGEDYILPVNTQVLGKDINPRTGNTYKADGQKLLKKQGKLKGSIKPNTIAGRTAKLNEERINQQFDELFQSQELVKAQQGRTRGGRLLQTKPKMPDGGDTPVNRGFAPPWPARLGGLLNSSYFNNLSYQTHPYWYDPYGRMSGLSALDGPKLPPKNGAIPDTLGPKKPWAVGLGETLNSEYLTKLGQQFYPFWQDPYGRMSGMSPLDGPRLDRGKDAIMTTKGKSKSKDTKADGTTADNKAWSDKLGDLLDSQYFRDLGAKSMYGTSPLDTPAHKASRGETSTKGASKTKGKQATQANTATDAPLSYRDIALGDYMPDDGFGSATAPNYSWQQGYPNNMFFQDFTEGSPPLTTVPQGANWAQNYVNDNFFKDASGTLNTVKSTTSTNKPTTAITTPITPTTQVQPQLAGRATALGVEDQTLADTASPFPTGAVDINNATDYTWRGMDEATRPDDGNVQPDFWGNVKGKLKNADWANIGWNAAALSPVAYNLIQGVRPADHLNVGDFYNPQYNSAINLAANRRYDIQPELNRSRTAQKAADYNIRTMAGGLGSGAVASNQLANYATRLGADQRSWQTKQYMDNKYRGEEAQIRANLGAQRAQTRYNIADWNKQSDAARRAHLGAGFSQLGQWGQVQQQMRNQQTRDSQLIDILPDMFGQVLPYMEGLGKIKAK